MPERVALEAEIIRKCLSRSELAAGVACPEHETGEGARDVRRSRVRHATTRRRAALRRTVRWSGKQRGAECRLALLARRFQAPLRRARVFLSSFFLSFSSFLQYRFLVVVVRTYVVVAFRITERYISCDPKDI